MPPQLEKNPGVPTAWQDEALARDGVSREVPGSALKGETVPDSLPCEKYYKPLTVQYYITNCVSWISRFVGLLNKLDLWTHSWKGTHSYLGNLLYYIPVSP